MPEQTLFPDIETVEPKKKKRGKAAKEAEEIGTSKELYNFLFEACNIIRGPVSQDAFKEYITPLLYFKRISDVYDEETQAALDLSDGDQVVLLSFTKNNLLKIEMPIPPMELPTKVCEHLISDRQISI